MSKGRPVPPRHFAPSSVPVPVPGNVSQAAPRNDDIEARIARSMAEQDGWKHRNAQIVKLLRDKAENARTAADATGHELAHATADLEVSLYADLLAEIAPNETLADPGVRPLRDPGGDLLTFARAVAKIGRMLQLDLEQGTYGRMGRPNWTSLFEFCITAHNPAEMREFAKELDAMVEKLPDAVERDWILGKGPPPGATVITDFTVPPPPKPSKN